MKKILALALAFVMVMGLASVAFAADAEFRFEVQDDTILGTGKNTYKLMDRNTVYVEDEDGYLVALTENTYEEGDSLYIKLNAIDMTATEAGKWKVKADWRVGGDIVDSVEIVYKKIGEGATNYGYYVVIKTNANATTRRSDLLGYLSIYRTSPSSADVDNNQKVLFAVDPANYARYGIPAVKLVEVLNGEIEPNSTTPVVSFKDENDDYLDEEVICFQGVGEFEINLYEQGNLYLGFNTDFNKEIADKYPEAELEFVNFVGKPAFNKWGVFYLYADEDNKYVYEMVDGVISKVDATWDETMDAYRFAAKRFDTFITSDVELDLSAQGTTEGGDKPNPGTGR